jgi:hypothetical protein
MYWLRAMLRETAIAYKRNDGYYYTSAIGNVKVDWDPLILYYVYNQVNNTEYWEDGYSHDTYAPEDYDSKVYFIKDPTLNNENGYNHNVNKGMDFIAACYNNTIGAFLGGIKKVTGWSNIPDKLNIKHIQEVSFDTGGYTGSWDSSGRLAILHQKELVLNAADTENFLTAVEIVRELSNAIDLRTLAYQSMFSQAASAASINEINRALQQEVTIKAEFPNARDRNEIEEAFKSLVNHASQFANREKY